MATKKKENNENTKVSGKKAETSAVNNAEAEAAREKFQEKLKELLSLAKKKKNMLEYQEISDFFADMQLDSDKFEKILDFLEANNIDVLRITDVMRMMTFCLKWMMMTRSRWRRSTFLFRTVYPLKIRCVCT